VKQDSVDGNHCYQDQEKLQQYLDIPLLPFRNKIEKFTDNKLHGNNPQKWGQA
jgi:hypothetical protein